MNTESEPDFMDEMIRDAEQYNQSFDDILTDREYALTLHSTADYESQLSAIRALIQRGRSANQSQSDRIDQLAQEASDGSRMVGQLAEMEWVDAMHDSVFLSAAESLAAVGMLAPLLESFLKRTFAALHAAGLVHNDPRFNATEQSRRWDPEYTFDPQLGRFDRRGIAAGSVQLLSAIGIVSGLPSRFSMRLTAFFAYRNKMLHEGIEWRPATREAFDQRIVSENWPANWFSWSTTDGKPWVCTMSDRFVDQVLDDVDALFAAIGKFAKQNPTIFQP